MYTAVQLSVVNDHLWQTGERKKWSPGTDVFFNIVQVLLLTLTELVRPVMDLSRAWMFWHSWFLKKWNKWSMSSLLVWNGHSWQVPLQFVGLFPGQIQNSCCFQFDMGRLAMWIKISAALCCKVTFFYFCLFFVLCGSMNGLYYVSFSVYLHFHLVCYFFIFFTLPW